MRADAGKPPPAVGWTYWTSAPPYFAGPPARAASSAEIRWHLTRAASPCCLWERICAVGHSVRPDWGQARAAMVSGGDEFAPDPRAARAYQEIDKVYATLNAFTDPLFRSMADRLQDLEHAPGPGRG